MEETFILEEIDRETIVRDVIEILNRVFEINNKIVILKKHNEYIGTKTLPLEKSADTKICIETDENVTLVRVRFDKGYNPMIVKELLQLKAICIEIYQSVGISLILGSGNYRYLPLLSSDYQVETWATSILTIHQNKEFFERVLERLSKELDQKIRFAEKILELVKTYIKLADMVTESVFVQH